MKTPVQVTFRRIAASPVIEEYIQRRAAKLETFSDRMTRCHVTIEGPHRRHRHGESFRVRIEVKVPGADLVVGDRANENPVRHDLRTAIDDAFDDACRVLQNYVRRLRDETKLQEHAWRRQA